MGGPAPIVRPATLGDVDDIVELFFVLDSFHAELHPSFFRARQRPVAYFHELIAAEDALLIVAEEGDRLLGVVAGRFYDAPDDPIITPRRRVHFSALVVRDGARRRGLGRALMEAGAAWGSEQGAEEIVLTVWAGNEDARALYEDLGYHPVNVVMAKDL